MAPRISKEKDKGVWDSSSEKHKAHLTMSNKMMFVNLVLEQRRLGNRPGEAFTSVGWDNISKAFNKKTCLR